MDQQGLPPRISIIQDIVSFLLSSQLKSSSPLSKKWMQQFVNCHNKLKSKYNCRYDHQQALCENSKIIREWFQYVLKIVQQYSITEQNIYNFDKTGFSIRLIATAKIVTGSEMRGSSRAI